MTDTDPPRLKDDPEMSGALRRDLASISTLSASTAFDVDGGLVRLRAAIAAGGGPGSGHGGGTTAPAGSMASGLSGAAVAGIVVIGLLPLGAVIAIVVMARDSAPEIRVIPRSAFSTPVPVPVRARSVSAPPEAPPSLAPSSAPALAPIEPAVRERVATSPSTATAGGRLTRNSGHVPISPNGPAGSERVGVRGERDDDSVRREIEHMAQLRRVLRSDPARALALANAGQHEFRRGQLNEEREAIAVLALARLGRHAALDQRGARFLRRYPRSAFAERIARQMRRP